jgi:hypothetical protein
MKTEPEQYASLYVSAVINEMNPRSIIPIVKKAYVAGFNAALTAAPTVATDNSGEKHSIRCASYTSEGLQKRGHKPGECNCKSVASPVEEEQEYLWRQVDKIFNVKWSYGMPDHVMEELKEKFILTRKS